MTDDSITLRKLSSSYMQGRVARGEITALSARKLASRLRSLDRSFGDSPIVDLDVGAVDAWRRSIGHHSPATRRAYLSSVKVFCAWLVSEGYIATDPTAGEARVREPRRVPRALPARSVAQLMAYVADDKRARAIVYLMVGLGLRCCEVANLQVGDFDPDTATMFIIGKGANERVLPVPPDVARALDEYLQEAGRPAGPMIRRGGRGTRANLLSQEMSRLMAAAGIKRAARDGVSAHALRHTAASDVLDRCHDVRTVQAILGHVSIATTERYLRRADLGRMRAAMEGRDYSSAA